MSSETFKKLIAKEATIGVIGLGYVGLPLARAFCAKNINVVGFDIDEQKVKLLNSGSLTSNIFLTTILRGCMTKVYSPRPVIFQKSSTLMPS